MTDRASFTVGITTKDRVKLLAVTVGKLAGIVPETAELLVIDDGSNPPIDSETWGRLPFPVRLIRHGRSTGYITARNELARECRTPFLLSCDDDSYPIAGSVSGAAGYLQDHPELIALSFPYLEGPARKPMNPSKSAEPYRVRQFIGCAHLMRIEYFRELAGYWEWLVQQNEERELCYRALQHGWGVAHYPGVTVYHDYTPDGRNWERHDYYTMRNEMAVELRRIPLVAALFKAMRNGFFAATWTLRQRRARHVEGYLAGLIFSGSEPARLKWKQYKTLLAQPWA